MKTLNVVPVNDTTPPHMCTADRTPEERVVPRALCTVRPDRTASVQQETINSQWAAPDPKGWLPVWNDG